MDCNINIVDSKKYYYVISYYEPNNDFIRSSLLNTDISIFEIDEWNELLSKSEIYKKYVNTLNGESDYGYFSGKPELRSATYYLYYNCYFCKHNDFTSLEYYKGYNRDIYERVFMETKNKDRHNITINNFREWITDNYEDFNKNYSIIKMYDSEF